MALQDYQIFTKPNKWLEPRYARPYYDILDKRTGKVHRIAPGFIWNTPQHLIELFGPDTIPLTKEIVKREKEIEGMKNNYIQLYEKARERYDAGQSIPRQWLIELEDLFDQMYHKDVEIGDFVQGEDTLEAAKEREKLKENPLTLTFGGEEKESKYKQKPTMRTPETEAPHYSMISERRNMSTGYDQNRSNMELSAKKLARKCNMLLELEKDDVSGTGTTGPTPIRAIGYVGESSNTGTPGYRNPVYDKKKKKKEKNFMKAHGFIGDIEELTNRNKDFRRVLYTGNNAQLVLMRLKPKEEIGEEVHESVDQFFRVDSGAGMVIIDGKRYNIKDGTGIVVPAGSKHNVMNISSTEDLKLYTIYSPPEHKDKVVRETKEEAIKKPEEFDGKTTE